MNKRSFIFTIILIAFTVIIKLICAPKLELSGFTTIIAIALFAGMSINKKSNSFILPLVALFVSDVIIEILYQLNWFAFHGFYKGQLINYILLLIAVLVGWLVKGKSYTSVAIAAFIAPTLFFLLSNFEVWVNNSFYTKSFEGLMQCYIAALPFYTKSLISTLTILPLVIYLYNYLFKQKSTFVLA